MPTYVEMLEEALNGNCERIADLCELRETLSATFDERLSRARSVEDLLACESRRSQALSTIDAEIWVLSKGSKSLMLKLGAVS
jgi:hypothetical protein